MTSEDLREKVVERLEGIKSSWYHAELNANEVPLAKMTNAVVRLRAICELEWVLWQIDKGEPRQKEVMIE